MEYFLIERISLDNKGPDIPDTQPANYLTWEFGKLLSISHSSKG